MGHHVNAMALAVLEDRICNTSEEKSGIVSLIIQNKQKFQPKVSIRRDSPEL